MIRQEESMHVNTQTTVSFRFDEEDRFFFENTKGRKGYAREIFIQLRGSETLHDCGVWARGPVVRKSDGELGLVNVDCKLTWSQFNALAGSKVANKIADAVQESRTRHSKL